MLKADRRAMRAFYATSWRKFEASQPLEPLEAMVADVVGEHREYHAIITDESQRDDDFAVEHGGVNPFLHLGLHVALREQSQADRPPGFAMLYAQICSARGDRHEAEHKMMECLGEAMWAAQRSGTNPDELAFLECVRRLRPLGTK